MSEKISMISYQVIIFLKNAKIQFETKTHKAKIIILQYIHGDQSPPQKKKYFTTESGICLSRLFLVIRLMKRFLGVYEGSPFT